jgi:hypothetical protein
MTQSMLVLAATVAEAAPDGAVASALDARPAGKVAAFAIALIVFLIIGTLLFWHRWRLRRGEAERHPRGHPHR